MIKIDFSKLNTNSLNKNLSYFNSIQLEKKINKIYLNLKNKTAQDSHMSQWIERSVSYDKKELEAIKKLANKFHNNKIEHLVVIGIGGSFLGSKASLDFLLGKDKSDSLVSFVGNNMDSDYYHQTFQKIKNKKWALCVISKSGTTLETSLGFRIMKEKLIEKYKGSWKENIVVITDKEKGSLRKYVEKEKLNSFEVPSNIGGRFSLLTPVGLFPLAFAKINIEKLFAGAKEGIKKYNNSNLKNNDAAKYAIARWYFGKKRLSFFPKSTFDSKFLNYGWTSKFSKKRDFELLAYFDNDLSMFAEWWKQLFAESEGKNKKAILPISSLYSQDLHSLGQIFQEGNNNFFETFLMVEKSNTDIKLKKEKEDFDNLNSVVGKYSLNEINKITASAVEKAHREKNKVPTISIWFEKKDELNLGQLVTFYFMSITFYCYLLKVNPFDQPGVEVYKRNILEKL